MTVAGRMEVFEIGVVKQTTPKVDIGGLAGIKRDCEDIDIRKLKIE
ncbi:TPA_asm: hypothetical protein [Altiarchaeum virus]|nr:TPA_asm: hypothetical protein [Altiarchaeum virus]